MSIVMEYGMCPPPPAPQGKELADLMCKRMSEVCQQHMDQRKSKIDDFHAFLSEIGWSEEQIYADMESAGCIPAEEHEPEVEIKESGIHGFGCFAPKNYRSGDRVCIVRFRERKTLEGRYINHAREANVEFVMIGEEMHAFARTHIIAGEEILVNYRQSFGLATALIEAKAAGGELEVSDADSIARSKASCMAVEKLQSWLAVLPQQTEVLRHDFTDGIYARQSVIDAGAIFTTETHKIDHPFALTEGEAFVWSKDKGWNLFKAPLIGVTKAGTRRVVVTKNRCVMTTFHPNPGNEKDLNEIWDRLYVKRKPPVNLTESDMAQVRAFMASIESAYLGQSLLPDLGDQNPSLSVQNLIPNKS